MEARYEEPGATCPIGGLTGTECALEVTRQLFTKWTLMTSAPAMDLGAEHGPAIALELLRTDDTNVDLTDGTPHFYETCNGLRRWIPGTGSGIIGFGQIL